MQDLRSQIAADLRPVRPLRPGRSLLLAIAFLVVVAGVVLWQAVGFRSDYDLLGSLAGWVVSGLEGLIATVLLFLALRESVPGRRLPWSILSLTAVAAALIHPAAVWLAFTKSATLVAAGEEWQLWRLCFAMELCLGLPVMAAALSIASRGLPSRLLRVGLLCGTGAGLVGDALWRLYCPFSDPVHVASAHTTGILAVSGIGLAAAWAWDRVRLRRWRGPGAEVDR